MIFYPKVFTAFLIVLICCFSCKKKPTPDTDNPNPPVICNTADATLVKNDTILNIIADTAYPTLNNTYYTEHMINATHGCSIEFEDTVAPAAGNYVITPIFNEVVPGSHKVYIQYYLAGNSYSGQSGTVSVTGSGTSASLEFCKIKFKDSFGDEKTLSIKTDSE